MEIKDCKIIELPKIKDYRGHLTFIESPLHIPFDIKRIYYLYDVKNDVCRGEHAHKALQQLIIPISGHFDVILDDGLNKKSFHLSSPEHGLYVCPMMWREIKNFSSGSVCMVLASEIYDEDDYIRDYQDFMEAKLTRKN